MRRLVTSIVAVGLLLGTLDSADAKPPTRSERTIQGSYGPFPAPVTGCNEVLGTYPCMVVQARSTETYFSAKLTDTHGQPVFAEVLIYSNGLVDDVTFCGGTDRAIRIPQWAQLEFHVGLGFNRVTTDCPAGRIKTTGTITVTFSNRP